MAEASSQVRQNYDHDCEDAVNAHIQLELYASYVYLSMAFYFDRDDVAEGNFKHFFLSKSHTHKASAEMFMSLQNKCGGCIVLRDIARPDRDSWHGAIQAMESAFHMEMNINQNLLNLHALANGKGNTYLCDFMKQHCLDQQVQVMKEVSHFLTSLRQMGASENGLAEYLFNKLSLS
ncbi:ferritin heavy polypeptide-like 17 [Cricetulus griseus]|uniref:Ferritin n=1 Tax=Cricetulus griseus TaxID=10029 RepID=G3IN24_CRIGR|nr:ferritin heavy polypeptide-like 17 [Cricetulus griseus]XP_027289126.1 ferritin heavy polypeptide-like 17 [Cricetulus griseus]EGW13400.1 Ferritin heavy polypeptide-like 17 [Cricetulus griseus]ERE65272.1 ferritin heavy polypeptide-like 17-like protein [Cricetulus griseus]